MNLNNIKKNNKGSTLIISLIVLSIFLTVGMIVSNIVIKDIGMNRAYGDSNYAYYAADMGLKKAIWLLNNEIFSNSNPWGESFYESGVDMCPGAWNEITTECPCPISPSVANCVSSSGQELIISDSINGANYEVYIEIEHNTAPTDNLDRTITLTSIGTYRNAKRKLEYNTCLGNFCNH